MMPRKKDDRIEVPYRYPSGRLVPAPDTGTSPAAVRRLRDAALRGMASDEWGTELGRLFLIDRITSVQYAAGRRWDRTVIRCREALGASALAIGPNRFELITPAAEPDADSAEGRKRLRRARQAIAEMRDAAAALRSVGQAAEKAVQKVCEEGRSLDSWSDWLAFLDGLTALARHWGLTKVKNNGTA